MKQVEELTARLKNTATNKEGKEVITTIVSVNLALNVTDAQIAELVDALNPIMEKPINLVELVETNEMKFGGKQ